MPSWFSDQVIAALVAAVVAAAGVAASILAARRETAVRTQELSATLARLTADQESMRQQQLTEILRKRIETYPALWEIISVYGRNWEMEARPFDHAWAITFLKALLDNSARNGAFFSTPVYDSFGELRTFLYELSRALETGRTATAAEVQELYDIIRGPVVPGQQRRGPGLGSYIKDELGSYVTTVVSVTHRHRSD